MFSCRSIFQLRKHKDLRISTNFLIIFGIWWICPNTNFWRIASAMLQMWWWHAFSITDEMSVGLCDLLLDRHTSFRFLELPAAMPVQMTMFKFTYNFEIKCFVFIKWLDILISFSFVRLATLCQHSAEKSLKWNFCLYVCMYFTHPFCFKGAAMSWLVETSSFACTRFKIDAAMPVSNNLRGQEILCSFAYCLSYFYCIIDTDLRHCLNKLILCDLYIAIFFAVSHVLHIMAQCWHNLSKIIALIHWPKWILGAYLHAAERPLFIGETTDIKITLDFLQSFNMMVWCNTSMYLESSVAHILENMSLQL